MDSHEELLKRLPAGKTGEALTLADIMSLSPAQLRNLADPKLTRAEAEALFKAARKANQENTVFESRLLSRANPQLTQLARLGVAPLQEARGYTETFEQRAESYVAPGSVSSMFSPAAYLTELYREASALHPDTSANSLKKRRPDLGKLLLSQANMDTEVSTLTLSNEILMDNIANHHSWSPEQVTKTLSTYRLSGNTPYHSTFEAVRQSILQQDPGLSVLAHSPHFSTQLPPQLLMATVMAMPPELLNILTEAITDNNTETLYQKNFGTLSVEHLSSVSNLAHYYDLSMKEITTLTSLMAPAHTHLKNTLNSVAIDSDGQTKNIAIIEKSGSQLNYAHLVPLMGGGFGYEFSVKETIPAASTLRIVHDTTGYSSDHVYFEQLNLIPQKNTRTRIPLTMLDEHLYENPLKIGFLREIPENGSYYYSVSTYTTDLPIKRSLLYLNKLIRLYKAFGISLSDMERFLLHTGSQTDISEAFLTSSAYAKFLSQQYGIPLDSTLMFCGIDIGTQSTPELSSQFDLLFNTPPLNGQTFALGSADIEVDPNKLDAADSFRRAVLKRAWQVDDAGLYQMHLIGDRTLTKGINNTLASLSDLYRIALLAQTHALTIDELNTLLLLSPYRATKLYGIDEPTLKALTQYLFFTTEWLAQQKWSVYQLFVMTTDIYSTVWTPAIGSLQQTLLNGLGEQAGLQGDALVTAMAPFIASSLHLNAGSLAESILLWANQIKPNEQTVDSFWSQIQKETPTQTERNNIIAYAQVLAQLSVIVNAVNISEQELALLVKDPALISAGMTTLGLNVGILQQVTLFHRWINGSGAYVDDVLTALDEGTLSAELLANSLQDQVTRVTQAMAQAVPGSTTLTHWDDVFVVIQWLKMSATLHITPDSLADLMALNYDKNTTYAAWSSLGNMMLGGLNSQQSEAVKSCLDEHLSSALSAYYIREVSPVFLGSRDALYSHLLIDNQVSAQVKTSRLAEAIASVQLYVHRALNGPETDADTAVLTRQFFVDWDTYNARYSTWAGVSQLVYYPENYIDPTLRVGQTAMMDKLLQQISQSALSKDVVELGVLDYLTAFDEIANLDIVGGYHDNADVNQGLSYFVSSSQTEPKKFYWRSVDHSKSIRGVFPANAWSEWRKITCAITPWEMMIRPVLLNSRLFISWVERTEQVGDDGTTVSIIYTLKLSRMNYDGGWSSPFSYDITAIFRQFNGDSSLSMYCSEYEGGGMIIVYIYKKEFDYTSPGPSFARGLYINADMSHHIVDMADFDDNSQFHRIKLKSYHTLDTHHERKINNIYSNYLNVDLRIGSSEGNNDYDMDGDFSSATCQINSDDKYILDLSPSMGVSYKKKIKPTSKDETILKIFSKENEQFIIYESSFKYTNTNQDNDEHVAAVVTIENNELAINISNSHIDYHPSADYPGIVLHFSDTASTYSIPEPSDYYNNIANAHYRSYRIPLSEIGLYHAITLKEIRFHHKDQNNDSTVFSIYTSNPKACVSFHPTKIIFGATTIDNPTYALSAQDGGTSLPHFSRSETMRYAFKNISLDVTSDYNNKKEITIPCSLSSANIFGVYAETAINITVSWAYIKPDQEYISLHKTPDGSHYMQQSVYRTRLNTLFATQLIGKASAGLDAIFSMDTQLLPEPKLGEGTYVTMELSKYESSTHGSSREFTIEYIGVYSEPDRFILKNGILSDTENTVVTLFVPRIVSSYGAQDNLHLQAHYQKGYTNDIRLLRADTTNPDGWRLDKNYKGGTFPGLASVSGLARSTEPMDFNGANALYFWELFYYTPMMVHARLLQEVQYDEALRWLKCIWSPAGYVVHGELQDHHWNCRPLEEDTSWNATPLDSVDPDAVAQNDPMHYKVAAFMSMLDLLIARGDAAYRQLERDTLNEAKMWYTQALDLLGDEPYVPLSGEWEDPSLDSAASTTSQNTYQQALLTLRETGLPAPLTANSLTALFLPEVNGKLQSYWRLLAQRLYNLRHNLSIDGQPLSLPLYATPISPEALLSAAVATSQGGGTQPKPVMPLYRFPVALGNARNLVGQLMQFGSSLLGIIERQDSEAMAELLQTQARDLSVTTIAMQDKTIAEVDADEQVLRHSRQGAQARFDSYVALYDENINTGEQQAMDLYLSASVIAAGGDALRTTAAALDLVPNIYGLAVGGAVYGAAFNAMAIGTDIASQATRISADRISYNETYRRRRQEWAIQRNNAEDELKQIDAQLASLSIRRESAVLQKAYLKTQQAQVQAQLEFLQRKFSNKALYNWLRGCLSAIYYQFYDLTASRCLMSQEAYRWETNQPQASFIKPGAWNSTYAGLMAGENLMLNLTQMEDAYLKQDERPMEVTRTASLAQLYAALPDDNDFVLADEVGTLINSGRGQAGTPENGIKLASGTLISSVKLADLAIMADYPAGLGEVRRIKQISVTLPLLMGPYQDVQAVLSYGGSVVMPRGCDTLAVSHGMNDSGQFQLDFNDAQFLPFEGIPVNDTGTLTLSFPNATDKQKTVLLSLSDIILHIRYTIRH